MQLTITDLNKTYSNGVHAINNVNLTINQGMFGLLGPNGAGKSSLMRTIATLQEADAGSIMLGDINVLTQKDEVRKTLGYLPQEFGVYPKIDALTLLDHLAVLKGITNKSERKELVESLLQKTNLWEARTKNLGGYSGGMKQRFGIAQALIASPKLIIVDEPTAGLDPAERNRFLNLLSELGENTIVILSTHIVEDVKELCSDMAIINRGQVLYKGNPFDAMAQLEGKVWQKRITKAELNTYKEHFTVISDRLIAGTPVINVLADTQPEAGFVAVNPDLEDVYFGKIFANA
ncbi:ABC transporter ATP-binding protein [Flectobacillus sp. BAB-3569]|uniref:ABC transporter ATP-binding protein n=1 Tax=Flectobacillus sp. BAB-3569 TaxID=1509483 RepID=UPI000BA430F4|nr:ABC transporter ATP-binding protein [Flectobacillus sp. BAB-3569]NBA77091.1 ATP-binding cassette domain-containing protein [Emticicia sp. ODNR4P]PAC31642.1 multidrug ABC transporter ATP-binding protein [Flectobacillus sp. BAB-3569]